MLDLPAATSAWHKEHQMSYLELPHPPPRPTMALATSRSQRQIDRKVDQHADRMFGVAEISAIDSRSLEAASLAASAAEFDFIDKLRVHVDSEAKLALAQSRVAFMHDLQNRNLSALFGR